MKLTQKFAALLLAVSCAGSVLTAQGQVAFNFTGNQTYNENFDSMGTSGTTPPTGWTAVRGAGSGILGQVLTLTADAGTSATANGHNYGTNGINPATDRALGTLASGTTIPYFGASFTNTSGGLITNIVFGGTHEQWRTHDNNTVVETCAFEYSLNATSVTNGTWIAISGMDLVEILTGTTANGPVDGNASANRAVISGVASGISWPNNSSLWIRWRDANNTGTDGGYAIDDFSLAVTVQPPGAPPAVSSLTPSSIATNAGGSATFTLSTIGDPATNFWYKVTPLASPTATNLFKVTAAGSNTLTLANVLKADEAGYFVVLSNSVGRATSSVVSLTVTDPYITVQPNTQAGLLNGRAQFSATAIGTSLTYQWYYCADANDNSQITSAIANGVQTSGAIASGATTSTLSLTNIQFADATNFALVITGSGGSVTSSVASLTVASVSAPLAFWTFNGPAFDIVNPAPYQGIGTSLATNVVTLSQTNSFADTLDSTPLTPNNSWGTTTFPPQNTLNKKAGVQFNASTVGAKNIGVSFDIRGSGQASKYYRLQYTTNGSDFMDYPQSGSILAQNTYEPQSYSLSGIPGVANNTNFGIRVVAEAEGTAKYNNTNSTAYIAVNTASTYIFSSFISYDLIKITGDAITNNNNPPVISANVNTKTNLVVTDGSYATNYFTLSDDFTPTDDLTVSVSSLYGPVSPTLTYENSGGVLKVITTISLGNSATNYTPILVTVTDASNDVATTWFTLSVKPANAAPVLTGLDSTNTLINSTLVIPYLITDETDPGTITPTISPSIIPALLPDANITLGTITSSNRTLTVTPVAGQSGTAPITVSVNDGVFTTIKTLFLTVTERTNVILADNFKYDFTTGDLTTQSGGFWANHGGTTTLQVTNLGYITIDSINRSEDVNALLLGAPYLTNSSAVLYSKMVIKFKALPSATGAYFAHFKDDSTAGFYGRIWASTSGAAPGKYRVGIANTSASSFAQVAAYPVDLDTNVNYTIVSRLVVSNSFASIWVNPATSADIGATDTTTVTNATFINRYAFRQSNTDGGSLTVSNLVVGTTFASVTGLPAALGIRQVGANVILNWNEYSYALQSATNLSGPYTTISGATTPYTNAISGSEKYYRLIK